MEDKAMLLDGISPNSIWSFICIGFALIGVFLVIAKFIDTIRAWIKEREEKKALGKKDITEEIATKVIEKLEPKLDERFDEIDRKLAADKETINSHTTQLNDHESRVSKLEGGNLALCHGILALLEQDPNLSKEQKAMKNFLIDGKYREQDWQ